MNKLTSKDYLKKINKKDALALKLTKSCEYRTFRVNLEITKLSTVTAVSSSIHWVAVEVVGVG